MDPVTAFDQYLAGPMPALALAPMQDITDLGFWRLISSYGGPDIYWTEYFRVHGTSSPEKWILDSLIHNPTGKPAVAQMIGNDVPALVRTARELQQYSVAAIDLNLGCPAPIVYRKCAGGGLLREPKRIDAIVGALRDAVSVRFTVKTRIGFSDPSGFEELLGIFSKHSIDLLTVHGRTVADGYRPDVRYPYIARAVEALKCPVLANGNVFSTARASHVLKVTGARGLMIGRGCIRNPWIFDQIRATHHGEVPRQPKGRDLLEYVERLYVATEPVDSKERLQVEKMKKYMNFVGDGLDPAGGFLHGIRRATDRAGFFAVCRNFLDHDQPMSLLPSGVPEIPSPETEVPVSSADGCTVVPAEN